MAKHTRAHHARIRTYTCPSHMYTYINTSFTHVYDVYYMYIRELHMAYIRILAHIQDLQVKALPKAPFQLLLLLIIPLGL